MSKLNTAEEFQAGEMAGEVLFEVILLVLMIVSIVGGVAEIAARVGAKAAQLAARVLPMLAEEFPVLAELTGLRDAVEAERIAALEREAAAAGKSDAVKRVARAPRTPNAPPPPLDVGVKWRGGIQEQGMPWEDYLTRQLPKGSRLPANFKTWDFFDDATGKAISAKTLDTSTESKLADPSQIYSSLKSNIDAAEVFSEYQLKGIEVTSDMISSRELQVAVPASTNPEQWIQINNAVQYGKNLPNPINVVVTPIK